MPPHIAEGFFVVIGLLSMSAVGLIGLKTFLNYRLRRQELEAGGSTSDLRETVNQLRADLDATQENVRAETAELHERLDFTERLLTQQAPGHLPKPRANTPV